MHLRDEAPPTAVEMLAMEIVELREDVAELRHRLSGQDSAQWDAGRAQRWKRTLAIVEGAIVELAEQRQAEAAGRLQ